MCNYLILILLLCQILFARPFGPSYYGFRSRGMGNASIAVMDDWNALYVNPAGLNLYKKKFGFYGDMGFGGDWGGIANFVNFAFKNAERFTQPDSLNHDFIIELIQDHDNVWHSFSLYPDVFLIAKDFGLGIYSTIETRFALESGVLFPKIGISGTSDWVLASGISNVYDDFLSVGMIGKSIIRVQVPEVFLNIPESVRRSDLLQNGEYFDATKELSLITGGMSFDIGTIFHLGPKKGTKIGLVFQDILGFLGNERILIQSHIGIAQHVLPAIDGVVIKDFVVALDLKDIFRSSKEKTFPEKVHMGMEIKFPYNAIRMGFNQGYFTFGLGLNYHIVHFDYLYYNEELGNYVGQRPNPTHSFKFGLGIF